MTRVDFHFNAPDKLVYGCRLLRKIYRTGKRTVVYSSDEAFLARFDRELWTFSPGEFVPHVSVAHELASETPIVLSCDELDTDHHDVIVNLGPDTPPHFSRFERLIEVVGADEKDRIAARDRWRFYRDRGYPMVRHDLASKS